MNKNVDNKPYYLGMNKSGRKFYCHYPNIHADVYYGYFTDAIENRARAAGVTEELFMAVLWDGEELTLGELIKLYDRYCYTTSCENRMSFECFVSPVPSIMDVRKRRHKTMITAIINDMETVLSMDCAKAGGRYSRHGYEYVKEQYPLIKAGKPLYYVTYLSLINQVKYLTFCLTPKTQPVLRGLTCKGALWYEAKSNCNPRSQTSETANNH